MDSLFKMTQKNKRSEFVFKFTVYWCILPFLQVFFVLCIQHACSLDSILHFSNLLSERERGLEISYKYTYKNCINWILFITRSIVGGRTWSIRRHLKKIKSSKVQTSGTAQGLHPSQSEVAVKGEWKAEAIYPGFGNAVIQRAGLWGEQGQNSWVDKGAAWGKPSSCLRKNVHFL